MEGRSIMVNLLKLLQIMGFADRKRLEALILSIDFEKCFNLIDHTAIQGLLQYFGYGPKFIKWIMLLFTDFEVCTQNNGYITQWLHPSRGVHQGCCVSPHLYNCTGQVFVHLFEHNTAIEGILAHQILLIISQFADDTSLFTKANRQSLQEIVSTLEVARGHLGLKTNYDKTTIYRIGSLANSCAKIYTSQEFTWDTYPIYILGIYLSLDQTVMSDKNLTPLLDKAWTVLQVWKGRDLTLMGRVLVVNTLVESLLVYRFSIIPYVDPSFISEMNRIILQFIWQGKRAKINHRMLMCPKDQGGLRLVELVAKHTSLLAQWIFTVQQDAFLQRSLYDCLLTPVGDLIWSCSLAAKDVKYVASMDIPFWPAVIQAWCKVNFHEPVKPVDVVSQCLWFNSHIRVGGKPFMHLKSVMCGCRYVGDILADGEIMTFELFCNTWPQCMNWLEYFSLINAILHRWKILLSRGQGKEPYPLIYEQLSSGNKVASVLYYRLVSRPCAIMDSYNAWGKTLGFEFGIENYEAAFRAFTG